MKMSSIVSTNSFSWTFQPLIICYRFLGMKLHPNEGLNNFSKVVGILLVTSNIFINSATMYSVFKNIGIITAKKGATMASNTFIDYTNDFMFTTGVHLVFFLLTYWNNNHSSWSKLWQSFEDAEQFFIREEFQSFRKLVNFSLFVMLLVTVYTIYIATAAYEFAKTYFWISLLALYFQLIPKFIFVLFSLMTWMMSNMFHILASRIDELREKAKSSSFLSNNSNEMVYHEELRILVRLHGCLCEITYQLSKNFGLVVLIGTIYSFIGFISSTFRITNKLISKNLKWIEVAFFLDYACLTILLIIIPNKLHQNESKVKRALRKLDYSQHHFSNKQVNQFCQRLHDLKPSISGMDFFNLSLESYPKLIGTTLTYLVILCQFQSAEQ